MTEPCSVCEYYEREFRYAFFLNDAMASREKQRVHMRRDHLTPADDLDTTWGKAAGLFMCTGCVGATQEHMDGCLAQTQRVDNIARELLDY